MRKILFLLMLTVHASPVCAATYIVNVGGPMQAFAPSLLTITAGDTVTFINRGGTHNVVADDGSFRCAHGCDGAGGNGTASSSNWVASVTFAKAGTVGYFCETHGTPTTGMHGSIIVQAATPVRLQSFEVD